MKILVLGADGMLGHRLIRYLSNKEDVYAVFHGNVPIEYKILGIEKVSSFSQIELLDYGKVSEILAMIRPEVVINAAGRIKQRPADASDFMSINGLFPRYLMRICGNLGIRLILLSTDCVFSGRYGNYTENDFPDAQDVYGLSKLAGEGLGPQILTLRTSMIGWQIKGFEGLLSWFVSQRNSTIQGFKHAIFNGLSTQILSELIYRIIKEYPALNGIYNASGNVISKYDLLIKLRNQLNFRDILIEPYRDFHCDRSLSPEKLKRETGWIAPGWQEMISGIVKDWPLYREIFEAEK